MHEKEDKLNKRIKETLLNKKKIEDELREYHQSKFVYAS